MDEANIIYFYPMFIYAYNIMIYHHHLQKISLLFKYYLILMQHIDNKPTHHDFIEIYKKDQFLLEYVL